MKYAPFERVATRFQGVREIVKSIDKVSLVNKKPF